MRRREKSSIVIVIAMIIVILGGFALLGIVPREQKVFAVAVPARAVEVVSAASGPDVPAKLYNQQAELDKLNSLVGQKTANRVFDADMRSNFHPVLTSNYDKEIGYQVDAEGRVMFSVDKGAIRNKSAFHWLWWKINSLYDKSSAVAYATDPDEQIAAQAKQIMDKAAQAH